MSNCHRSLLLILCASLTLAGCLADEPANPSADAGSDPFLGEDAGGEDRDATHETDASPPRDARPPDPDTGREPDIAEPEDAAQDPNPEDVGEADVEADAGADTTPDTPERDAGEPIHGEACTVGEAACTTWDTAVQCANTAEGGRWLEVDCPGGQGCFQGRCVADRCADDCALGQTQGDRRCEAWDMARERWVETDADRMHDRARAFEKWLRHDTDSLLHGGLVWVRYETDRLENPERVYFGDTPLHTGLYLAAEAYRLEATGSVKARRNVRQMVETFHFWFDVHGDPGNLATIAARAGDRKLRDWTEWSCDDFDRFCNIEYQGERWDYVGDPSRDMYMGPLLGLPVAYDALGEHDEEHREMIRKDLVVLAEELIRLRTLRLLVTINGFDFPAQDVQTRFFIPESRDMQDGAIHLSVDLDDIDNSGDVRGGQEFLPNPTRLLEQINLVELLLGNALPDVPRSSSALMVPAILQAAMHVTDGVPAYAERREAIRRFYYENDDEWGNIDTWLDGAASWINDRECGERYFGINLTMIPAYVYAWLEPSDHHRQRFLDEVLEARLWDYVHDHRNPFFTFMYSEVQVGVDPSIPADAASDLGDFPAPPRVRHPVDLRNGRYGRMDGCSEEVAARAIDLDDRPAVFFQWHSPPWQTYDRGNDRHTYPGHDYLLAYWMGRSFGFVEDDTRTTCLRWR